MKKYSILGVLWLAACGANAGLDGADESTLESPLSALEDDATDPELTSALVSNEDEESDEAGGWEVPQAGGAPPASHDAPGAGSNGRPEPAPGNAVVTVGAGGRAWQPPAQGVVVWCHASVPLGCPGSEPAPSAGRLVMVTAATEPGDGEGLEAPRAEPGFAFSASPASPTAAPPGAPRPIELAPGGSVPPLPGTCVAVTFGTAGGTSVGGGNVTSEGGPGTPSEGGTAASRGGIATSEGGPGTISGGGTAASESGPGPIPGGGIATSEGGFGTISGAGTAAGGTPNAGNEGQPLPAPPPFPALPPPGACLNMTFAPPPPAGLPSPGTASPGEPPPPPPRACIGVAFAADDGTAPPTAAGEGTAPPTAVGEGTAPPTAGASGQPRSRRAPPLQVICAAGHEAPDAPPPVAAGTSPAPEVR